MQRTTHSCSCCWVNEVCPVACGPQREAHFLCTAHKLQRGQNTVGSCFNIASQIQTYNNNSEMWQDWLFEEAGLCPAPLPPHAGCSSVWPSQLWWEWWALTGTTAQDLTHTNAHTVNRWDNFLRWFVSSELMPNNLPYLSLTAQGKNLQSSLCPPD